MRSSLLLKLASPCGPTPDADAGAEVGGFFITLGDGSEGLAIGHHHTAPSVDAIHGLVRSSTTCAPTNAAQQRRFAQISSISVSLGFSHTSTIVTLTSLKLWILEVLFVGLCLAERHHFLWHSGRESARRSQLADLRIPAAAK